MAKIPLTQGKYTLVDAADYDELMQFSWSVTPSGYAQRSSVKGEFKGYQPILMHRHVTKAKKGKYVDHINGNKLDNRRENLRLCSNADNCRNRKFTGSRGITFQAGKWVAQITVNYKRIYLGRFADKDDAKRAYDKAAKKHYGEFATLNFKESA